MHSRARTNHRNLALCSAIALLVLLSSACGGEGDTSSPCGSKGEEANVGGDTYCVYDSSSGITETGFQCPGAYPNRHSAGDLTVCSEKQDLPEQHEERIRDQYGAQSGIDAGNGDGTSSTDPGADGSSQPRVGQNSRFTDCQETPNDQEYCAAERLNWSYDSGSQVVSFDHTRVVMNCGGNRSIRAYETGDGTYRIREIDAPVEGGGRAGCRCSFNYGIDIPDVSGSIDVEIVRETTDAPEGEKTTNVWSGTIELSNGSGTVTISEESTVWCSK